MCGVMRRWLSLLLLAAACDDRRAEIGCESSWDDASTPWATAVCEFASSCAYDPENVPSNHDSWCIPARAATPLPDGWAFDGCRAADCVQLAEDLAAQCASGALSASDGQTAFYSECGDISSPTE